jgi:hypothetical protein
MPGKLIGAKVQVECPANIGRIAVGDEPSKVRIRKPALSHLLTRVDGGECRRLFLSAGCCITCLGDKASEYLLDHGLCCILSLFFTHAGRLKGASIQQQVRIVHLQDVFAFAPGRILRFQHLLKGLGKFI